MSIDYSQWQDCMHDDEPRDQEKDLAWPYWAQVGPDNRLKPDGWSWTILESDGGGDSAEIADGFADDEAGAKAAVDRWAAENGAQ